MFNTPILFLIFNRPDTTERIFEEIKKQKPKYLYVAADGPRADKEGETENCKQTREIISRIDWDCELKTLFRDENLGCKIAVSSALNWFFENVEEGIILEDDCLPSKSFFNYCEILLEKYRNDTRIMCISGENPLDEALCSKSYYFSPIPHIWGWASWRRAWNLYDVDFKGFDTFIKFDIINNVFEQKEAHEYWNKIFNRVKNNEINTWDYQWTYALFVNNGLSIIPTKNMVSNIGFGHEQACHTSENSPCANREVFELGEINHPQFICASKKAVNEILKVRYDIQEKTPLFILNREISRALRKLVKNA
ncbi:MAG: nucleotide-diphospho-sugar transferase [bacterium]